jgi:hypothetical protein
MGCWRFLEVARTKSFPHEHPPPVGLASGQTSAPRFLSVLLVETPRAAALVNTFLARLLKNQERPMVLIRCNYVRMPADESETIPHRIFLD